MYLNKEVNLLNSINDNFEQYVILELLVKAKYKYIYGCDHGRK